VSVSNVIVLLQAAASVHDCAYTCVVRNLGVPTILRIELSMPNVG